MRRFTAYGGHRPGLLRRILFGYSGLSFGRTAAWRIVLDANILECARKMNRALGFKIIGRTRSLVPGRMSGVYKGDLSQLITFSHGSSDRFVGIASPGGSGFLIQTYSYVGGYPPWDRDELKKRGLTFQPQLLCRVEAGRPYHYVLRFKRRKTIYEVYSDADGRPDKLLARSEVPHVPYPLWTLGQKLFFYVGAKHGENPYKAEYPCSIDIARTPASLIPSLTP